MTALATRRLGLRPLEEDDAAFFLELVNTRGWLDNIGERNIHTVAAAREALLNGPIAMQAHYGYSLYAVRLPARATPIGICGLVRRALLPDPDIGYAFLPEFHGQGYAFEAASRVLTHAANDLRLPRLLGLSALHNAASIHILEKLGMHRLEVIAMCGPAPDTLVYARALTPA